MGESITNETLAVLMKSHHAETSRRLDKIDQKQEIANGRLGKAEVAIAVLQAKDRVEDSASDDSVVIPKKYVVWAFVGGGALVGGAMKLLPLLK